MKDWIKPLGGGLIGGLAGGIFSNEVYLNFNWTAFACFVSVVALIVTTCENRRRFKKDWKQKQNTDNANAMNDLVSQFIGNYQRCQTITVAILLKTPGFGNSIYESKISEMISQRNDIIFVLDSIISQIKMLKIRMNQDVQSGELFDQIDKIKSEINQFFRDNNPRSIVSKYEIDNPAADVIAKMSYSKKVAQNIKGNCEHQNEIVNSNIESLQEKASNLYIRLTKISNSVD